MRILPHGGCELSMKSCLDQMDSDGLSWHGFHHPVSCNTLGCYCFQRLCNVGTLDFFIDAILMKVFT